MTAPLSSDDLVEVTVTAADEEWLTGFVRGLVADGLVACGNLFPIRSIYAWDADVVNEPEVLAVLHTRNAVVADLKKRVRAEHPYDVPQVLVTTVVDADPDYRAWVVKATGGVAG